jgi:hypothetical protein
MQTCVERTRRADTRALDAALAGFSERDGRSSACGLDIANGPIAKNQDRQMALRQVRVLTDLAVGCGRGPPCESEAAPCVVHGLDLQYASVGLIG